MVVNVLFPPAVQSRYAGQALQRLAEEMAALLEGAGSHLAVDLSAEHAREWLEDARRLNRHVPGVDRVLTHAEESRRLNVRALGIPRSGRSLRGGLEALELCSIATRSLFRSIDDWVRSGAPEPDERDAPQARRAWAELLVELAAVVRSFGALLRAEVDDVGTREGAELSVALQRLRPSRERWNEVLLADPREHPGLWELNGAVVALVDRMLVEFDAAEHARLWEERRREAIAVRRRMDRLRQTGRKGTSHRDEGGDANPESEQRQ